MAAVIAVDRLSKQFRRSRREPGLGGALRHLLRPSVTTVTAVDDISFSLESGESVAYVGPNGAASRSRSS